MAGERCVIGEDDMVTDDTIMRDMAVREERAIITNLGQQPAARSARVHRHALADGAAAADFQPDPLSSRRDNRSAAQRQRRVRGKNRRGEYRVQHLAVPVPAVGPSVASMWRALDVSGRAERYGRILAVEFDAALAAQLAKR